MTDSIVNKVKETAIEDAQQAKILLRDAAKSGVYLYPMKVCKSLQRGPAIGVDLTDVQRVLHTFSLTEHYGSHSFRGLSLP
jgi:hypothetical protein